jgi:hypothetical protein
MKHLPNRSKRVRDRHAYFKRNSGGCVIFGWNCAFEDISSQASHTSALRLMLRANEAEALPRPLRRHAHSPAVSPFSIKIVRMIGGTAHLSASPSLILSSEPEG